MKPDDANRRERTMRVKLLEEDLTREIIGSFYEVYNDLGFGFREGMYKRALVISLREKGISVDREFPVEVFFHGQQLGAHRLDMFVERRVVVEVKATHKLAYADKLQLVNYLTALNLEVGLLLHFGPKAEFKRVLGGWRPGSKSGDQKESG
jgi:GxxExxY protein